MNEIDRFSTAVENKSLEMWTLGQTFMILSVNSEAAYV